MKLKRNLVLLMILFFIDSNVASLLSAASSVTGAATGDATGTEGEADAEKKKNESNTIVQNNAYKGFNENSMTDVVNRNLRDDLLSSIEGAVHELSNKINSIETNFQDKITKVQDQVKNILPKEEYTIKLKLAELNKQRHAIKEKLGNSDEERRRLV